MKRPFVDTSAWFAFVNQGGADHARVREIPRAYQGGLLSSGFIFDETVALCRYRPG